MQSFLDIPKDENKLIEEYSRYLRERGYIIIEPKSLDPSSVKNASGLVDLFYSLLQYYNQDRKLHYVRATKKDLGMAKQLIDSRQSFCSSRKKAIEESALIVKCVVEYENFFGFSEPLHSFDCFGNNNMKWVIDRAISIINEENDEVDEYEYEMFMSRLSEQQEKTSLNSLDEKIKELKEFLHEHEKKE